MFDKMKEKMNGFVEEHPTMARAAVASGTLALAAGAAIGGAGATTTTPTEYYGLDTMQWLFGAVGVICVILGAYLKDFRVLIVGFVALIGVAVIGYLGL